MLTFDLSKLIDVDDTIREFAEEHAHTYDIGDVSGFIRRVFSILTKDRAGRLYAHVHRVDDKLLLNVRPHYRLVDIFFTVQQRMEAGQ